MTQLSNVSDYPTDNQDQPGIIKIKPRYHLPLPDELRTPNQANFNPSHQAVTTDRPIHTPKTQ